MLHDASILHDTFGVIWCKIFKTGKEIREIRDSADEERFGRGANHHTVMDRHDVADFRNSSVVYFLQF